MHRQLVCPTCGEANDLTGTQGPEGIIISCERCGTAWPRDSVQVTCATCEGHDLVYRPQATTNYSRGNQVSILGWRDIPLCGSCDERMLLLSLEGKPVPYRYRPAALDRREPGEEPDANMFILPQ